MKLERLIAILTALLQKERISATWFAEKFGVSVRTIYRDIAALEGAGIPIVTHAGVNGGISIIDSYKIDNKLFTSQDITTLLTSLYSVSGSLSEVKINQTLEKIKALIPEEQGRKIELTSKQLYVDMTPWASNPLVSEALEKIQQALEDNHLIRFDYQGRYATTPKRTAEPHQLVLKENKWYLRAYCRERSDFRTFKVSRIKEAEILPETFIPRAFDQGMTDFKDWQSKRMIFIDLIVDESLRERALDFCHETHMCDLPNGKIAITMPFVESDMGYGVLLSMGHRCTVIGPAHVRAELIRQINLLHNVYTNIEE